MLDFINRCILHVLKLVLNVTHQLIYMYTFVLLF